MDEHDKQLVNRLMREMRNGTLTYEMIDSAYHAFHDDEAATRELDRQGFEAVPDREPVFIA